MQEKIIKGIRYLYDELTHFVIKDPKGYVSLEDEKERYDEHHNDLSDPNYYAYQTKILELFVRPNLKKGSVLEFGCGQERVFEKLLLDYKVSSYDLFYHPNEVIFEQRFDHIVTIETVEHFKHPFDEFSRFHRLLNDQGHLIVMTQFKPSFDLFDDWWYIRDKTHICFYDLNVFDYLAKAIGFEIVYTNHKNFIVLKKI